MKVLIFIALKIVEVTVIIFVPFCLGKLIFTEDIWILQWFGGILVMSTGVAFLALGYFGMRGIVKTNWRWAESIKNKLRR